MNWHALANGTDDGFERPTGRAQRWAVLIGRAVLLAATLGLTSGIDAGAAKPTPQAKATGPAGPQAMTVTINAGGRAPWR